MESSEKRISLEVIKRLPRYYRYIGELLSNGIDRISSKELSKRMNVTASQIRQDLNCFGGFGQQGYGYNVEALYNAIGEILGIHNGHKTIIIGAGRLGQALANTKSFEKRGFHLIGIFDSDKEKIGTKTGDYIILDMTDLKSFMEENKPNIAILAVPKASANEVAKNLADWGIQGMMNFCYTDIDVPEGVAVQNVHLSDTLMMLSYQIKNEKK